MNMRAAVGGHNGLAAGILAAEEGYDSSNSVPWYRQEKWRIIMLIATIIVIGAVVGGGVGGTIASKTNSSTPRSSHNRSSTTLTVTLSTIYIRSSAHIPPRNSPTSSTQS